MYHSIPLSGNPYTKISKSQTSDYTFRFSLINRLSTAVETRNRYRCLSFDVLCSIHAVSYTHLDVYKRQTIHILKSVTNLLQVCP